MNAAGFRRRVLHLTYAAEQGPGCRRKSSRDVPEDQ